jgi:RHS repeat-associated protein
MIAEYNGSSLTKRYVFGPAPDEPIVAYDANGNRSWLYSDERGSIVASANAAGAILYTDTYDEYGNPPMQGATNLNSGRFQYTGQMYLPEVGMYYYKARMYSTTLGRFMQTDAIGYSDGPNWYAYVHNDPVNGTDSLGLADMTPIEVNGIAIGIEDIALSAASAAAATGILANSMTTGYGKCSSADCRAIVVTGHRPQFVRFQRQIPYPDLNSLLDNGLAGNASPNCPVHIPPGRIGRERAQQFGPRSYEFHNGQDFPNPRGAGVYAPMSGVISSVFFSAKGGNSIVMQAGRYRFGYAHSVALGGMAPGVAVAAGQRIGSTNVSGHSTGPHLHFTVKVNGNYMNPLAFLAGACGR